MPGLIDTHSHAVFGGLEMSTANMGDEVVELAELEKRLRGWRDDGTALHGDVINLSGMSSAYWGKAEELGRLFNQGEWAKQPVVLAGSDHHTGWANNAMLERAGIDARLIASLPEAERGTLGARQDGQPNGFAVDAGWDRIAAALPPVSPQILLKAAEAAVKYNNSLGITAWMDPAANAAPGEAVFAMTPTENSVGILPVYKALADKGELSAHVVDTVQGLCEILAYGRVRAWGDELAAKARRFFELRLPFLHDLSLQTALQETATGLGGLAVIAVGAWLVQQGRLDPVALPLLTLLALSAFVPLWEVAQVGRQLADTLGAARRLHVVETEPVPVTDDVDYRTITDVRSLQTPYPLVPGETIHGITRERITLPGDIGGWLEGRSRFARLGLMIHVTSGFVQPGVTTRQVLEISNVSARTLLIHAGVRLLQIVLQRCEGSAVYQGRFADQDRL